MSTTMLTSKLMTIRSALKWNPNQLINHLYSPSKWSPTAANGSLHTLCLRKGRQMSPNRCQVRHESGTQGEEELKEGAGDGEVAPVMDSLQSQQILEGLGQNIMGSLRRPKGKVRDESRFRGIPVPYELSMKYMESAAYKRAYGDFKVWQLYRRQHKGQFFKPPSRTRTTCLGEDNYLKGSSPCPICRDEFLVLHYKNVKLLQQFIDPFTAKILPSRKTNICQMKHEELLVAMHLAKDYGTLSFYIPFKSFDYNEFYLPEQLEGFKSQVKVQEYPEFIKRVQESYEVGEHHDFAIENFP